MSLAEFSQWVADLDIFTSLRESALAYPIIMSLHLSSIAVFGGLILMTDLRLLGLAMPNTPVSDVIAQTRVWKRIGFVIMVTCGVLLAGAKLDKYYDNPYFQLPVIPPIAKTAACLSLILWIGVLSFGRWIAYYERPGQVGRAPASSTQPLSRVLPSP
jgi:hypothetical protein